jgi:hypothetical protein
MNLLIGSKKSKPKLTVSINKEPISKTKQRVQAMLMKVQVMVKAQVMEKLTVITRTISTY